MDLCKPDQIPAAKIALEHSALGLDVLPWTVHGLAGNVADIIVAVGERDLVSCNCRLLCQASVISRFSFRRCFRPSHSFRPFLSPYCLSFHHVRINKPLHLTSHPIPKRKVAYRAVPGLIPLL
jgi:hypothetical protein